jgi:hypothetical protein
MCDVAWDPDNGDRGALTGRLRLSNGPAADWIEALIGQIIEDRENGLPVPNVGLSADLFATYQLEGSTRVATNITSVYSVDVVFYPASGGSFDRVLNSVRGGQPMPDEKDTTKEAANQTDPVPASQTSQAGEETRVSTEALGEGATEQAQDLLRAQCQTVLEGALTWCDLPQPMKDAISTPERRLPTVPA